MLRLKLPRLPAPPAGEALPPELRGDAPLPERSIVVLVGRRQFL
jgi:hypothetical protein